MSEDLQKMGKFDFVGTLVQHSDTLLEKYLGIGKLKDFKENLS